MTAYQLVSEEYVLETKYQWEQNMGEQPNVDQLTTCLWWNEETTNEYDLDEQTYFDLVYPFVETVLAESK